jgi:exodeoxyribonuclease VII large subunit
MAVPVRRDLLLKLAGVGERQEHAVDRQLAHARERLSGLGRGLSRPESLLGLASQRLDDLTERLVLRGPRRLVEQLEERLSARTGRVAELLQDRLRLASVEHERIGRRLQPDSIADRLAALAPQLARDTARLDHAQGARLTWLAERLAGAARQLDSLSHRRVLERGYAIVRTRGSSRLVPSLAALGHEIDLELSFADGELAVRRLDAPRARARTSGAAAVQEQLL